MWRLAELKVSRSVHNNSLEVPSSRSRFLVGVAGVAGDAKRGAEWDCALRAVKFVDTGFDSATGSGVFSLKVHVDASDKAGESDLIFDAYLEETF